MPACSTEIWYTDAYCANSSVFIIRVSCWLSLWKRQDLEMKFSHIEWGAGLLSQDISCHIWSCIVIQFSFSCHMKRQLSHPRSPMPVCQRVCQSSGVVELSINAVAFLWGRQMAFSVWAVKIVHLLAIFIRGYLLFSGFKSCSLQSILFAHELTYWSGFNTSISNWQDSPSMFKLIFAMFAI